VFDETATATALIRDVNQYGCAHTQATAGGCCVTEVTETMDSDFREAAMISGRQRRGSAAPPRSDLKVRGFEVRVRRHAYGRACDAVGSRKLGRDGFRPRGCAVATRSRTEARETFKPRPALTVAISECLVH
jgi:hypothetical protein